jgi:hypothetical protein
MTRTDELGQGGARRVGGGGGSGFVKWTDSYGWLEGRVTEFWEGRYGRVASIELAALGGALTLQTGAGDEKVESVPSVGDTVNVGLNYSALEPLDNDSFKGKLIHVAFEGWQEGKDGGNRYRVFKVYDLSGEDDDVAPTQVDPDAEPDEEFDDDLPF